MKTLRKHRQLLGWFMTCLMTLWLPGQHVRAEDFYKSGNATDTLWTDGTAWAGMETAPTATDIIVFNSLVPAARTFRIGSTNFTVGGIRILNNVGAGGTITLGNDGTAARTLTLGSSGIDMLLANASLTFANQGTGSLTVATSADQTWINRTGRTISLAASPLTLSNNLTLQGAGTTTFGGNGTGPISGAGNLLITGAQSGGATVVNLSGTNTGWTGAVTVGNGSSHLRLGGTLNLDQTAASQNKIADASTLTINNATVNLQGSGGGTETVAGVALGRGLNAVTRSAGTGILQMNGITRVTGAAVNFGNIATTGSSHVTTDVLNTAAGQIGAWAVGINGTTDANWIKTAAAGTDISALALSGTDYTTQNALNSWTVATQNILVTGATTASTASRTIGSLKLNTAAVASLDIGAGNTLTINDGANGGGILGVGNFSRVIGATTVGQGTLTAGAASDAAPDTLYLYNLQNTTTINMVIADNGTDALHLFSGGAGTVTINADNTFTGGTTIAAGTLNIGANSAASNVADLGSGDIVNHGTLVLDKQAAASAAQLTIANNITGTGAFTVNRGIATLSGVNDYSGNTNVSASTTLRAGSATGISSNSRMILNAAAAILNLNGFNVSVAALRGDNSTADAQLGANTLTLSGSDLANSSAAEILSLAGQNYQGIISGTGNLIKNGGYTQTMTAGGALTYTGTTTVNGGLLQFNKGSATTGLTINNNVANALTPLGAGAYTTFVSNFAQTQAATAAVNLAHAGSTWQINNGFAQAVGSIIGATDSRVAVARGAAANTLTVTDNGGSPNTFSGVIIETGTGAAGTSVVKDGTNTWVLVGGNNYSGSTTISGGTLQIGSSNLVQVLPDTTAVVMTGTSTLDLNGNSETIGSLTGTSGNTVSLGAGTLTVGRDNTNTTFAGAVNGTGGLTKMGNGTLTLSGTNGFTGPVTINSGGLTVSGGSSIGDAAAVTMSRGNGSTLTLGSNETIGSFTSGTNSTLALGNSTLTFGDASSTTIASNITGATGGLVKNGAGTVTLVGSSTYSGATAINAGSVALGDTRNFNNITSPTSAYTLASGATMTVFNFPVITVNLRSYTAMGSLAGAGAITLFNGTANTNTGALVFGADNTSTNFTGTILGNSNNTAVMKTGTGVFNWTNTVADIYDGLFRVENGTLQTAGSQGLDGAQYVILNNISSSAIYQVQASDTISYLGGGGRVAGFAPFSIGGDPTVTNMGGNVITGTGGSLTIDTGATLTLSATTSPRYFGGAISGAGNLTKANTNVWEVWGANTMTGTLSVTGGTYRTGVYGAATGLGAVSSGGNGTISSASTLVLTGGTLDLNGTTQSAVGIGAGSTGGTIALVNGALTLTGQTTQSTGTVVTGNLASSLTINGSGNLTLTGAVTGHLGEINVGSGQTLTLNRTGGDTLANTARLNLASGSTLVLTTADTVGSVSGAGNITMTSALTLQEARSGTVSAAPYSGVISGATALTLSNYGGLTLSGNNAYTGGTVISSGSLLNLSYGAGNNILPGTGALTLNGGRIQVLSTAAVPTILESVASTNLNAGASFIDTWTNHTADQAIYQVNGQGGIGLGAITRAVGATLNVTTNAASATNTAANGIMGGWAVVDGGSWAVPNGAGTAISALPLGSYVNTFGTATANTDVLAGGTGGNTNSIRFNTAGAATISGTMALTSGGVLVTRNVGANTTTISATLSSGASNELIINQFNPLGDLVLSNVGGTNTGITTAGPGRTIITNNIAGTGVTNVGNGVLQLGSGGATGNVGSGVILNNGTIVVNRSDTPSFGAVISGTGNFEQVGAGTTTLSAANTYQGRTTVRSGTLTVTNNAGLGAGVATQNRWGNFTSVNSGAMLDVNVTAGGTISEMLNLDGGTLRVRSAAASTLSGPIALLSSSIIDLGAGAAVTHVASGGILGFPGAALSFTSAASGSTIAITGASRVASVSIGANANVQLGNNGTTGFFFAAPIDIANTGSLIFDRTDGVLMMPNQLTGAGQITKGVRNTSVYLTGSNNAYAGDILVRTGALVIGDDTFAGTANGTLQNTTSVIGASGKTISVGDATTAANTADATIRFNSLRDVVTLNSDVKLLGNTTAVSTTVGPRRASLVKNSIGTLEITEQVGAGLGGYVQNNSGVLRLSGGLTDSTLAGATTFGGILDAAGGYFEIAGTANNIIGTTGLGTSSLGYVTGGAVMVHNSTGSTTFNSFVNLSSANFGYLAYNGTTIANLATPSVATGLTAPNASGINTPFLPVSSTANLRVGQIISGTNIPANAVITEIVNATMVRLNQNIGGTAVANATAFTVTNIGDGTFRDNALITVGPNATLQFNVNDTVGTVGGYKGGTLNLNGASLTLNATNIANVTNTNGFISAAITGTGGLIKGGSGATRFDTLVYNNNNSFSGDLTAGWGLFQVASVANSGVNSGIGSGSNIRLGSTVTINGTATNANDAVAAGINYVGPAASTNRSIILEGTGTTLQRSVFSNGNGALTLSGTVSVGAASTTHNFFIRGGHTVAEPAFGYTYTGAYTPAAPSGGYLTSLLGGMSTASGVMSNGSGTLNLVKDDGGMWYVSGANTFTGSVTVNNGQLYVNTISGAASSLGNMTGARTLALGSGANGVSLIYTGSGETLASTTTLNLSGSTGGVNIANLGTGALTIAATSGTYGGGAKTLSLGRFDDSTGFVNIYSGVIGQNSTTNTTSINKLGLSTWRLSGTNTFTGGTTVTEGLLQVQNGAALADGGNVNIANSFGRGATLELLSSETIRSLQGGVGAVVALNANVLTLGGGQTFNGSISGTGSLLKNQDDTATLGGASHTIPNLGAGSTFSGGLRIDTGRVDFANSAAIGTGAVTINGSTADDGLRFIGTGNNTVANAIVLGNAGGTSQASANGIWADGFTIPDLITSTVNFSNTAAVTFLNAGQATAIQFRGASNHYTLTPAAGGTATGVGATTAGNVNDNIFAGQLVDNGAGALSVGKQEAGLWVLTNANTYTGTTTITAGVLAITNAAGLGATTGGTTINGGAGTFLDLRNVTVGAEAITNSTASGGIFASTGTSSLAGTIATTVDLRVGARSGASLALNGAISGTGGLLTKIDDGTVSLGGANTFNTASVIARGTLALDYTTTDTGRIADAVALTLGGTSNYTLAYQSPTMPGALQQSFGGSATIELRAGAATTHAETIGGITFNQGAHRIIRTGAGTNTLVMGGVTRGLGTGGTVDFGAAGLATTSTAATNGILGPYATVAQTGWATAGGTVNALASYSADTYAAANNVDVVAFTAPGAAAANTLRFNTETGANNLNVGAAAFTLGNATQGGGILITPTVTTAVTISGGPLQSANAANAEIILHNYSAANVIINSVIQNNTAANGLTLSGTAASGRIILGADNTNTGATTINNVTLQVGTGGTAGSIGTGAGTIHNNGAIEYNVTDNLTQAGVISGDGSITKNASGTITLSGANTFHGAVTVNAGDLRLTNAAGLGSSIGRTTVNSGGTLSFAIPAGGNVEEFVNLSEGSTVLFTGNNGAITGTTTQGLTTTNLALRGKWTFNNTTAAGAVINVDTAPIAAAFGALGTTANIGPNFFGFIQSSNGFTKTGNGRLTLNQAMIANGVYSLNGQVMVNGGEIAITNARALGGVGLGNETIIASGAGVDLRGQNTAYGDEVTADREIFVIAGSGYNGMGALRSSAATAQVANLVLNANASVGATYRFNDLGSGRLDVNVFDTNINPGVTYTAPVIDGNGYNLTKVGSGDFVLHDITFANKGTYSGTTASSSIGTLNVNEGELRIETNSPFPYSNLPGGMLAASPASPTTATVGALLAADVGSIVVNYTSATQAGDTTGLPGTGAAQMTPNVGARLEFYRQHNVVHTVPISLGTGYVELNSDTIPKTYTYLDGQITLTGNANGKLSFFNVEGGGFGATTNNAAGPGTITPYGAAAVNPGGVLLLTGTGGTANALTGSGGFTKLGTRELRLLAPTNFSGDTIVTRETATALPIGISGQTRAEMFSMTVAGAGTLGSTGNVILDRNGILRIDNTTYLDATNNGITGGNNDNRINDSANLRFRSGWLVFDNNAANSEVLGAVNLEQGRNFIGVNLTDGANTNTTLTLGSINRTAGSTLAITNWDATSKFGATGGDSLNVVLSDSGASLGSFLTGAATVATNKKVITGVVGGVSPLVNYLQGFVSATGDYPFQQAAVITQARTLLYHTGRDLMTVDGTSLRPLDDSEYATALEAGMNVNLEDVHTAMRTSVSINALRFGPRSDNLGNNGGGLVANSLLRNLQDTNTVLTIEDGQTLTVASGMLLFSNFSMGTNQDMSTIIRGHGTINFGSQEGVIINNNLFFRLQDGGFAGNSVVFSTALAGSAGITKGGQQEVFFDGRNTYSGLTTIVDGVLNIRNNEGLGVGGSGNGVVISGSGNLLLRNGINVGSMLGNVSLTANGKEDILVKSLNGDQTVVRTTGAVAIRHYGDLILDNVDSAGMPLFRPRMIADANGTLVFDGNIYGGPSAVTNDVYYADARVISTEGSVNGLIILKGQVRDNASGAITGTASQLPTGGGFVNENETLRFHVAGNNDLNINVTQPWNAAGRLEVIQGVVRYLGDPSDVTSGGDFWTTAALSRIPSFNNNSQVGFVLNGGSALQNSPGNGTSSAFLLTRPGQTFKLANWSVNNNANDNNGIAVFGGENESGTVTYGDSTQSSSINLGRSTQLYTMAGGTVALNSRLTTNSTLIKTGRGQLTLNGSALGGDATTGIVVVAGGTILADYSSSGGNNLRFQGDGSWNFAGGQVIFNANSAAASTQGIMSTNGNTFNVRAGTTEIVAQANATRNMTVNIGRSASATDGLTMTRATGGVLNFVTVAGTTGVGSITIASRQNNQFSPFRAMPWATFGTALRSASDFAMLNANTGAAGVVSFGAAGRPLDERNNNVAQWGTIGSGGAGPDIAENGGAGFNGTLGAATTINTLLMNAPADSRVALGTNTLTISQGAILVATETGTANKTISGGTITTPQVTASATNTSGQATLTGLASTSGYSPGMLVTGTGIPANTWILSVDSATQITLSQNTTAAVTSFTAGTTELILHHYGNGTFKLDNVTLSGTTNNLVIAGPSMTGLAQLSAWSSQTGVVDLTTTTNSFGSGAASTGQLYVNGSIVQVNADAQLGTALSAGGSQLFLNGGALRWTGGTAALNNNRQIVIGGNGGVFDVVDANANLTLAGDLSSVNPYNAFVNTNGGSTMGVGDLIKMGAGTLTIEGDAATNPNYSGLIDVRQGTLRMQGDNTGGAPGTVALFGTNRSFIDGTVMRSGTTLEFFMGAGNATGDWSFEEWIKFEGNNTLRAASSNATIRVVNLNGVLEINGALNVDVVAGQTLRFGNGGGYTMGTGNITKVGQGSLEFRDNMPDWSGNIVINEGTVRGLSTGRTFGMGTSVTLGSAQHQGIANLEILPEGTGSAGTYYELFHNIDVTYNPLQTKRITVNSPQGFNDMDSYIHGNITLNDNLGLYITDSSIPVGNKYTFMHINGAISDGTTTSGNINFHVDESSSGNANERTNGQVTGYFVLNGNNSAWSGDAVIGINTAYDRDEITVVRLGNANALTAKNDVTLNQNSVLQVAGQTVAIGSMFTNTGTVVYADGSSGPNAVVENASNTNGTLTINQTTPVSTEVLLNAQFRDGNLPSHFFTDGTAGTGKLNVVKDGAGWVTLQQDNNMTGSWTVNGGVLQVGKNGIGDTGATTATGLTSAAGSTIAGSGQIHGSTIIGGNLRPGDEAGSVMGTLTFTAATTLAATSETTLQVQRATYTAFNAVGYNDPAFGSFASSLTTDPNFSHMLNDPVTTAQHDKVVVNGALTVTSGAKITLVNNGYTPTHGDVFNLLDWTTLSGSFNVGGTPDGYGNGLFRTGAETGLDLTLFELGGGFRWDVSLFNTAGIVVVVVPEPSRALFLMLGLLGLMMRRRRKAI